MTGRRFSRPPSLRFFTWAKAGNSTEVKGADRLARGHSGEIVAHRIISKRGLAEEGTNQQGGRSRQFSVLIACASVSQME
jgi:hypothetical protein